MPGLPITYPLEAKLLILGAYGDDTKTGGEFSIAWANFLASLISKEWRRPCLNAYFGVNSEHRAGKYLNPSRGSDASSLKTFATINVEKSDDASDYSLNTPLPSWLVYMLQNSGIITNNHKSRIIEAMNKHLKGFKLEEKTLPAPSEKTSVQGKVLAVMGGMGPIASAQFQKLLADEADKENATLSIWRFDLNLKPQEENTSVSLIDENFSIWRFLDLLRGVSVLVNDSEEIDFLVAPSNTFNGADVGNFSKIRGFSRLQQKLMNMLYVVADKVCQEAKPDTKIGLFSTSKLKVTGLYQTLFEQRAVPLKTTTDDEQNKIQKTIVQAKKGDNKAAQALIREVIQSWRYQGVDSIIFGCTEIFAAAQDILQEFPEINFIDTNKVLAHAAFQEYNAPGSVLMSGRADNQIQYLRLLTQVLFSTRFWIKQHPASKRGALKLPEGIKLLREKMNRSTSVEGLRAELAVIADTRSSKTSRSRSPITQDLYLCILQAQKDPKGAIKVLERIFSDIRVFDKEDKTPEFNVTTFQRTRALNAIFEGEINFPANLCPVYHKPDGIDLRYLNPKEYLAIRKDTTKLKQVNQYICENGSLKLKALLMFDAIENLINQLEESDFPKGEYQKIQKRFKEGLTLDELFVLVTLIADLGFDKDKLVAYLKGAQFFIPDNDASAKGKQYDKELCQFWMKHSSDPYPRPDSSHLADRPQYSLTGNVIREFLVGHRWTTSSGPDSHGTQQDAEHNVSGTFFQTERYGLRTRKEYIGHKSTFLEYMRTKENIGPYGRSDYLETKMYRLEGLNPKYGQAICFNAFANALDSGVAFSSAIKALVINKQNHQNFVTNFDLPQHQRIFDKALIDEVNGYFKPVKTKTNEITQLTAQKRHCLIQLFLLKQINPNNPLFSKKLDLYKELNNNQFFQDVTYRLDKARIHPNLSHTAAQASSKEEATDNDTDHKHIEAPTDDIIELMIEQSLEEKPEATKRGNHRLFDKQEEPADRDYPGAKSAPPRKNS